MQKEQVSDSADMADGGAVVRKSVDLRDPVAVGRAIAQGGRGILLVVPFRIVQPWGPDKARQTTMLGEHATAAAAFAEIDRISAQMVRTGAPSDAGTDRRR